MAHGPDPRLEQFPASAIDIDAGGTVCLPIPRRLIPHLLGALDTMRYPDFWTGEPAAVNRTTGQVENFIIDLILKHECPDSQPCEECPAQTECKQCAPGGGACFTMEDYFMPCLDLSSMLKLLNGVLYVKNDCCEWVALGALDTVEETTDPTVFDNMLPEGQQPSACGRAYAVWTTICTVVDAVWDHHLDVPLFTIGNIRAESPVNLTTSGIWQAVGQALLVDVAFDGSNVSDDSVRKSALAKLEAQFEATTNPLSNGEWDAVVQVCRGFGGWSELPIGNLYSIVAVYAIGRDRLSNVAQAGSLSNSDDCTAPPDFALTDVTQDWTGVDWSHFFDLTVSQPPSACTLDTSQTNQWLSGVGQAFMTASNGYRKGVITFPSLPTGATITRFYFLYKLPYNFNYSGATKIDLVGVGNFALAASGWYDSDPSQGGLITANTFGQTLVIPGGGANLQFQVEGYSAIHDQLLANSIRMMALAIGGTGTDPFGAFV